MFITQSFSRLETEAWRWGTSQESRNISGHTVFHLGTWMEPRPQSTWAFLARTDLTGKAFPTELTDRRKQSDSKIQFKRILIVFQDLYKTQDTVGADNKICFCRFLPFRGVRMNFAPVFIGLKILRICIFGV